MTALFSDYMVIYILKKIAEENNIDSTVNYFDNIR